MGPILNVMALFNRRFALAVLTSLVASLPSGCSSAPAKPDESAELKALVKKMNQRMESMEHRFEKLDQDVSDQAVAKSQTASAPAGYSGPKLNSVGVTGSPSDGAGSVIDPVPTVSASVPDPEKGFTNSQATSNYRQGMILLQSHKYSDASLQFSRFVQNYPDHAMAGSAQFYVGECYFQQKEYKLAATEFQRVLNAYERSAAVPDTLRRLAATEQALGKTEEAERYRQQLVSMFPSSPAAKAPNEAPAVESAPAAALAPITPEAASDRIGSGPTPASIAPRAHLDPVPEVQAPTPATAPTQASPSAPPHATPSATIPGAMKTSQIPTAPLFGQGLANQ